MTDQAPNLLPPGGVPIVGQGPGESERTHARACMGGKRRARACGLPAVPGSSLTRSVIHPALSKHACRAAGAGAEARRSASGTPGRAGPAPPTRASRAARDPPRGRGAVMGVADASSCHGRLQTETETQKKTRGSRGRHRSPAPRLQRRRSPAPGLQRRSAR